MVKIQTSKLPNIQSFLCQKECFLKTKNEVEQIPKPLSNYSFKNEIDVKSFLKENDLLPTPERKEENPVMKTIIRKLEKPEKYDEANKNNLGISLKQLRSLAIPMNYIKTGYPKEIIFDQEKGTIEYEIPIEMESKLTRKPNKNIFTSPARISKSILKKEPIKILKNNLCNTDSSLSTKVDEILINLINKNANMASITQRRESRDISQARSMKIRDTLNLGLKKSNNEEEESKGSDQSEKIMSGEKDSSSSSILCEDVNLKYKGNKNNREKGIYAERKDILKKNFLRSIRRFLWNLFVTEFDIKEINDKPKSSKLYSKMMIELYNKYFKDTHCNKFNADKELEELFLVICSGLMTAKYCIFNDSSRNRQFRYLVKLVMKKYSVSKYLKFFRFKGCIHFFEVLKESGFVSKIIESCPTLQVSANCYYDLVDEIIAMKNM